ncbi:hypothetical protein ACFE04_022614 [Oxalis oulophora]
MVVDLLPSLASLFTDQEPIIQLDNQQILSVLFNPMATDEESPNLRPITPFDPYASLRNQISTINATGDQTNQVLREAIASHRALRNHPHRMIRLMICRYELDFETVKANRGTWEDDGRRFFIRGSTSGGNARKTSDGNAEGISGGGLLENLSHIDNTGMWVGRRFFIRGSSSGGNARETSDGNAEGISGGAHINNTGMWVGRRFFIRGSSSGGNARETSDGNAEGISGGGLLEN